MNVLLVPAHPGFPGQIPQSRKTVVCCVCVGHYDGLQRLKLKVTGLGQNVVSLTSILDRGQFSSVFIQFFCRLHALSVIHSVVSVYSLRKILFGFMRSNRYNDI